MKTESRTGMLLLLSLLAVSVAAQERDKRPASQRQSSATRGERKQADPSPPAFAESNYVIGPEDVLDISVWKEPDFTLRVPVRPDGKISLPLLNDVQASGLTPTQLSGALAGMLKKYLTQPQVTVIVTQINSKRVYVLGEVTRPGPISLLPSMTVLQALATAGGLTQFANQKGIYVLRNENGKQNRFPFHYKEAIRGESLQQNIILRPGDTIVIP